MFACSKECPCLLCVLRFPTFDHVVLNVADQIQEKTFTETGCNAGACCGCFKIPSACSPKTSRLHNRLGGIEDFLRFSLVSIADNSSHSLAEKPTKWFLLR